MGVSNFDTIQAQRSIIDYPNSDKYCWVEDFDEEAATTQFESGLRADEWVTGGTNYVATQATYVAGVGGILQFVPATADNDSVHITRIANVTMAANPIVEARFQVVDITNVFLAAGLVEGSFDNKTTYDDDIALVGIDSDNGHGFGASAIVAIFNDNGGGAVVNNTGKTITAATYITIRIDLTDTEQPKVYVNETGGPIRGAHIVTPSLITGTVQAAASMGAYFMVQNLSAAADNAKIDYIKIWSDRV